MTFVPRTFTQIITDMVAYVRHHTNVTDFAPGSVIRTALEAAALEDDEQYFQMVQLLDIFSYTTAAGEDLDRRLADFNIYRERAKAAYGEVIFTNGNLVSDLAAQDVANGQSSLRVFDSSGFPISGYTIRVGERTERVQDLQVDTLDTSSNTFTLVGTTTKDIEVGDRVSLVSTSSPLVITSGKEVQAPATSSESAKTYRTTEIATINSGNYYSNSVKAVSQDLGTIGNTGSNRITQFVSGPPASGVGVVNLSRFSGGTNRESDQDFRARGVEKLQSLSRGTILALKTESIGVTDTLTGQRVVSSNVYEDFASTPEEVVVYVDDGSGFIPDKVIMPQNSLSADATAGSGSITLNSSSGFSSSGFVLVGDPGIGNSSFLAEYESVVGTSLKLVGTVPTTILQDKIVRKVDYIEESAEAGQRRFSLQFSPVTRNSYRVYLKDPFDSNWIILEEGTDYILNKGTGELSIISEAGLAEGSQLVANYSYYTNLIFQVQKVLEGDLNDSVNYPGVKAAGIFLAVETPTFKRINVRITISAESSFTEESLVPLVRQEVANYINSLRIGQNVIRSRIIDVAHNVTGVRSVTVQIPQTDVVVLENELPVSFDSNNNSLITVL